MSSVTRKIELLSPAKDVEIARAAILHGADAVYIGGPQFGARHNAGNELKDIAELVTFAHRYYAKVFVTLNTILHNNELEQARQIITALYEFGVDALIVQDMGILELDIPPIELHASTQCDIRTVEKAKFLSDVGFAQIVLARELNLKQIKKIHNNIDARIEFFIHGALCVAYSGQCYISHAHTGRSANRGDCSQACRLPYTLKDHKGRVLAHDKHLLSIKDNNQSNNLELLMDAGVSSFKIEGRYKDIAYVKNITAYYRQQIDKILENRPEFARASSGKTQHTFVPNPNKTFNRGSTDYFVRERKDDIGAFDSPKFIGESVGKIIQIGNDYVEIESPETLHNSDGLNVTNKLDTLGFRANRIEKIADQRYRIFPNEPINQTQQIKAGLAIYRNHDYVWQQSLTKDSSDRRIAIAMHLSMSAQQLCLSLTSEEGIKIEQTLSGNFVLADQQEKAYQRLSDGLNKLGQTIYYSDAISLDSPYYFVPNAQLNQLRRDAIEQLTQARLANYPRTLRKAVTVPAPIYPETQLNYLANVYNDKARQFYKRYGVELIESAYEAHEVKGEVPVMITKHCLRFAFHLCPKQTKIVDGERNRAEPMQLNHNNEIITLTFDCKACEMLVWSKIKSSVLKMPLLGE